MDCNWKKRPRSNAFPELIQNLDLVVVGMKVALCMSCGSCVAGWKRCCFTSHLKAKQWQWLSLRQPSGTNLHCCRVCSLSALICMAVHFPVHAPFSVVGFIVQPCTLLRRWWGLWWGTSWWKGNLAAQIRSQKTTHLSALGLMRSKCCSSSWGLALWQQEVSDNLFH